MPNSSSAAPGPHATGAAGDGWGAVAPLLADLTPEGFRRYMKGQMSLPGRNYAELGEAMGVDRDDARKMAHGHTRPLLHQAIAAACYFRAAERRAWPVLRRCPFCGNRNTLELAAEVVTCPPCGASAPLSVWNRPGDDHPPDLPAKPRPGGASDP